MFRKSEKKLEITAKTSSECGRKQNKEPHSHKKNLYF